MEVGNLIEKLPPMVSVERAAELAAVTKWTIRRWIHKKELMVYRSSTCGSARTLIDTRSLLHYLGMRVPDDD